MRPVKIVLAGTGTIHRLAVVSDRAVQVALALPAIGIPKVTVRTSVTKRWLKLSPTLTATRFLLAVTGRVKVIAIASCKRNIGLAIASSRGYPVRLLLTLANIRFVPESTVRAIELVLALVAVNALRVVLAVLANAATLVVSMDV